MVMVERGHQSAMQGITTQPQKPKGKSTLRKRARGGCTSTASKQASKTLNTGDIGTIIIISMQEHTVAQMVTS